MVKIGLSEEEKQILHGYFKTSPLILMRLKAQAILMRERGIAMKDIASVLSRHDVLSGDGYRIFFKNAWVVYSLGIKITRMQRN